MLKKCWERKADFFKIKFFHINVSSHKSICVSKTTVKFHCQLGFVFHLSTTVLLYFFTCDKSIQLRVLLSVFNFSIHIRQLSWPSTSRYENKKRKLDFPFWSKVFFSGNNQLPWWFLFLRDLLKFLSFIQKKEFVTTTFSFSMRTFDFDLCYYFIFFQDFSTTLFQPAKGSWDVLIRQNEILNLAIHCASSKQSPLTKCETRRAKIFETESDAAARNGSIVCKITW